MANENTRFYVTADTSKTDPSQVTVATGNTPGNSSIVEVSIAKASFEGSDGKAKLLEHLSTIHRKIYESAWPAI
jgi:hypothetical protein